MKKENFKKAVANFFSLVGITALSASLHAASFDCAKASTNVEKLICLDAIISKQDEQLDQLYKTIVAGISDKESFKQGQRVWLRNKRNTCKDSMCLMQVYHERIAQLNSLKSVMPSESTLPHATTTVNFNNTGSEVNASKQVVSSNFPLKFKLVEGDSYPLCQPYVDMLNETKYMEYPACERKILPKFKQFGSLDWVEVVDQQEKIKAIEDAIKMKYSAFTGLDSEGYRVTINGFKLRIKNGPLVVYKAIFDIDGDGNKDVIYKEILERKTYKKTDICGVGLSFYVVDKTFSFNSAKEYFEKGFNSFTLFGDNGYFVFEENIYHDLWNGSSDDKNAVDVYDVSKYKNKICGIKID